MTESWKDYKQIVYYCQVTLLGPGRVQSELMAEAVTAALSRRTTRTIPVRERADFIDMQFIDAIACVFLHFVDENSDLGGAALHAID